ncbi:YitT family protein [Companilactobacillus ginsenosidimutans]|uniref:Membrane protein n=1 Tax=Companilactobacillus ginsenosidimutans TaxID=1007676 RepID=A0A0H4QL93_9LACO|nr:YitT family protein [Companilactobacillus ginsenosidimutans]AKP67473.1 membrane protein [Companilactobacillus ginsenosidimutans]
MNFKWWTKNTSLELLMITIGCAIYAFSLDMISIPNGLADGGLSGITLIIRFFFHINPGISTLILNIPLIFIGFLYLGKRTMFYTLYGTVCLSLFLLLWAHQSVIAPLPFKHDLLLSSLAAGVLSGLGIGMVFRFNGTTGGSDIMARVGQMKFGLSSGKGILIMDYLVLFLSLSYLDFYHIMYSLIVSFILARMIDLVQEGPNRAKALFIISDQCEEIAQVIDKTLERGFTYLNAEGGYQNDKKKIIYLIIQPREVAQLKQLISSVDDKAFVTVFDAREVIGEGFSYQRKRYHVSLHK